MTKPHQPLRGQARNSRLGKAWMCTGVLALGCVVAPTLLAQNCTAGSPQLAVSDLEALLATCPSPSDFQAMYYKMRNKYGDDAILGQASVAGNLAIPVLRQFAGLPKNNQCTDTGLDGSALTALAKLGDENAYAAIEQQWVHPPRRVRYAARIDFIGNDSALQTLVEFLIRHANDLGMIVRSGPSDGPVDIRSMILAEIKGIGRRHVVPDLPDADYSDSGIAEWKAWLAKYKGRHLSTPVFESASDPYLQCLARRVEWGHADAILDIATFGGSSAEAILKRFPASRSGEIMGARELFPDIFPNEYRWPQPDLEIQGNVQAALLRLGDHGAAFQVATELNSFALSPGYFPFEAIRKLRWAGGKTAVGVLVDGLGNANRTSQDAQRDFDVCQARLNQMNQLSREEKGAAQKECDGLLYWAERRTSFILSALAGMVKDGPLPADAAPTAENSKRWKDWWAKNQNKAVFTIPPRASYDWH